MNARVLLVEDDPAIAAVIAEALGEEGHAVSTCASVVARDALLAAHRFDVMLTDVLLEDGDGLGSLAAVRAAAPAMPVIVLSAQNTLDTAVRASESEAFEYFPKPFDLDDLVRAVAQAAARPGAEDAASGAHAQGRADAGGASSADDVSPGMPFIGRSPAMQGVYRMITRVLRNDLTVLVTGESGTGKELVADAIHHLGRRRSGPLVAVNTAAIPRELIESELFGHEKGAFTGAVSQAIGKFEQAHGGTLFLDEIGDMPAEAQTRLLRALQSGRIRRVGGRHDIAVDVRIVAATNRALEPMIAAGTFREDLFYRLNVVPIALPPLRDRREDVGPLARHFLVQAEAEGLPRRTIDDGAIAALAALEWRGNVRELRNAVFRLALLSRDRVIGRDLVAEAIGAGAPPAGGAARAGMAGGPPLAAALLEWIATERPADGTLYQRALAEVERPLIDYAMGRTGGNQIAAARLLGINRNTLRKHIADLAAAARGTG